MHLVGEEPIDVVYIEMDAGLLLDVLLDLFVERFAFFLIETLRESADDAIAFFARHGEEGHAGIAREADMQCVVTELPIDLHIGPVKGARECSAFNSEPKDMAAANGGGNADA